MYSWAHALTCLQFALKPGSYFHGARSWDYGARSMQHGPQTELKICYFTQEVRICIPALAHMEFSDFHWVLHGSIETKNCCSQLDSNPCQIEFRVRRVIIELRRAAYWFPLVASYLCRPRSAFHSAFRSMEKRIYSYLCFSVSEKLWRGL